MSDTTDEKDISFDEQVTLLQRLYIFQEDEEVEAFLKRNPFLVPFLIDTSEHIKKSFPDAKVFLHTAHRAGIEDEEELVAFISSNREPSKAMEILKQFYASWWSQAVKVAQGKIAIGLECL